MKTKSLKNFTRTVVLASLTLLFGLSLPLSAGPSKHEAKRYEATTQAPDKSNGLNLPAPVADDSPINPASMKKDTGSGHSKKIDREKDPRKKRSRH